MYQKLERPLLEVKRSLDIEDVANSKTIFDIIWDDFFTDG